MALSYRLVKNKNATSPHYNKYFAKAVITGEIGTKGVADLIQRNCTVKRSDVVAVLTELADVLKDSMSEGKKVTLDGLGSFKPSIKGKYATTEEEFSANRHISGFRVNFTPEYNLVKTGTWVDDDGVEHVKKTAVADLTKDIKVREY